MEDRWNGKSSGAVAVYVGRVFVDVGNPANGTCEK